MGIGGTAMGHAALLAREAGHEVFGSDRGLYPPMSDILRASQITCHEGFDADRLAELAPDLVVVGNAQTRGNPEVEWLLETRRLRFVSLPGMLEELILRFRRTVVIAGTHGKTTTTALTVHLLQSAGAKPGFLIGGAPQDPPVGAALGSPDAPFVIEGDEYDSAFFDKRSKFIHYAPRIAVLNNLEFDHADIFRDLADIQRSFLHLVRLVPRRGWVVINGDDPNLQQLGDLTWTRVLRVGVGPKNDIRLHDFTETGESSRFALSWRGRPWFEAQWALPGLFNARNAAMAAIAAELAALDPQSDLPESPLAKSPAPALATFRPVRRRQEVLVRRAGLLVIEDFGHHPTAIRETLQSLRQRDPEAYLTAVFEPRSNTARTRTLQPAFGDALAVADSIWLGAVNRAERVAEADRFDRVAVAAALAGKGRAARYFDANRDLLRELTGEVRARGREPGRQIVAFFSNGDFDGIIREFAASQAK